MLDVNTLHRHEGANSLGLNEIVDHYERVIRALPEQPIIMGHSFGGIFTQMLLDRGLGIAGVGVEPGQPAVMMVAGGLWLRKTVTIRF